MVVFQDHGGYVNAPKNRSFILNIYKYIDIGNPGVTPWWPLP